MYFDVEINLLAIESIYESDGWLYGVMSRESPVHLLFGGRAKDVGVDEIKFRLSFAQSIHPQIPPAALLELVGLQEDDAEQSTAYLRKYGLPSLDAVTAKDLPKTIQAYRDASYDDGLVPFALHRESLRGMRIWFTELFMLERAALERNEATAEAIAKSRDTPGAIATLYRGNWLEYAIHGFRTLFPVQLAKVQFGAREVSGRLVPTMASYGVSEALVLFLLDYLHRETPFGVCENPQCKNLFVATRKSKKYCSARCQALIKVHRHRDFKKLELQTKKRRGPSRKSTKRKGGK
jgi:hypothetical protein